MEQSWQIKGVFQRVQELEVPRCKKWGKEGKRVAWLSKDLLVKLKGKKQMHREWEQTGTLGKGAGMIFNCVGMG